MKTRRAILGSEIHPGMYQPKPGCPCWHTVADAASALGVSESAVRRAAALVGVVKIRGSAVAGMVELWLDYGDSVSTFGYMPYFS